MLLVTLCNLDINEHSANTVAPLHFSSGSGSAATFCQLYRVAVAPLQICFSATALLRYFSFQRQMKNVDGGACDFWQRMVDLVEKWRRVVRVAINAQFLSGGL